MATATALPNVEQFRSAFRSAHTRRALQDVRQRIALAMRQADDAAAESDDPSLSGEAQAAFDALKRLLDELDQKIVRAAVLDDLEVRNTPHDRADTGFADSLHTFELRGMIAARIGADPGVDIGRSREISAELARRAVGRRIEGIAVPTQALSLRADYVARQYQRRDVSTTTPAGGPGGNLIATILQPDRYIDALRARTIIRQAGATVISDLRENIDLPKMKATAQVAWFAEGSTINFSDPQFETVPLRPRHVGAITEFSRNMLLQSTPDIEMIVRDDLSKLIALAIDKAALVGSGQGPEPLGICRAIAPIAGNVFSYDLNVAMRQALGSANVDLSSLAWFGNSVIDAYALMTKDAASRPMGRDVVGLGIPYYISNVVTAPAVAGGTPLPAIANPLILSNASDIVLGAWSILDIMPNALAETPYSKGAVWVRAIATIDVALRYTEAFAWADITAPPVVPPISGIPGP
jgi:HK97 family phage major capsid protein